MGLLVDTSVWSLAYRRDAATGAPEVAELRRALLNRESVVSTGMILLELLRGFVPRRAQETILAAFEHLEMIEPSRDDYIEAAGLANICRRAGVQIGSVDALIAQLAVSREHLLLTADKDFHHAAAHIGLRVWRPTANQR